MRRRLIVSLVILLFVGAVGGSTEAYNTSMVRRYKNELLLTADAVSREDWAAASRSVENLSMQWEKECSWVQLWVNHAETDAVSRSLQGLLTALGQRDLLSVRLYYGECVENFAHLHHRDAFTLKNIL